MRSARTCSWLAIVLMALCLAGGSARSATDGSYSQYSILGFSDDGRYVFFERENYDMIDAEVWIRVVKIKTGKVVASKRVSHQCSDEPCMPQKLGARIRARLYKRFGKPDGVKLKGSNELSATWSTRERTVRTVLAQNGELQDPELGSVPSADFSLSVTLDANGSPKTSGARRLYADTVDTLDNANVQQWPELYLQELALSPQGDAVVVVFGRKPFVIQLK